MKLKGNENIVIIRPDHIGDLVLTLPMAWLLKKYYPDVKVEFLVSGYNGSVIKYAGYVDNFWEITDSDGQRKAIGDIAWEMEKRNYDIAIFAKPDFAIAFAAYIAGITLRVGTSRRAYSSFFNVKVNLSRRYSNMHELDLNLKLLEPFRIKIGQGEINPVLNIDLRKVSHSVIDKLSNDYVIIHPGSKGSAANWPAKYYKELIERLKGNINIVITGQEPIDISPGGNIINLANKTTFDELMNIIYNCRLFISGSTGPIHIAAALGKPVLGLYPCHPVLGPHRWAPRGSHVTVMKSTEQSGHSCRINDRGTCECMEKISVESVYNRALGIIKHGENHQ